MRLFLKDRAALISIIEELAFQDDKLMFCVNTETNTVILPSDYQYPKWMEKFIDNKEI